MGVRDELKSEDPRVAEECLMFNLYMFTFMLHFRLDFNVHTEQ